MLMTSIKRALKQHKLLVPRKPRSLSPEKFQSLVSRTDRERDSPEKIESLVSGSEKERDSPENFQSLASSSEKEPEGKVKIEGLTQEKPLVHEILGAMSGDLDFDGYKIIKEGEAEILMHPKNQVFFNKTQVPRSCLFCRVLVSLVFNCLLPLSIHFIEFWIKKESCVNGRREFL
uniref:Putative tRNA guanine26-N2-dimethyltransferase 2 isoform X2 n=1 Tax=Rhizophora mucronata TaxID=61149 RepID=A0A2P2LIM9_RHIMU